MKINVKGVLNRLLFQDKQTLGWFYLYEGVKQLIRCSVLELPFIDNENNISSICLGRYKVKKRWSPKFKNHFILIDVDGREYILIHKGNYYYDTQGCLIFGLDFSDINKDGYLDVINSVDAMSLLWHLAPDEFELTINEI